MKTAFSAGAAITVTMILFLPRVRTSADEPLPDLQFTADVFACFPTGKVARMSPGDGIYYQACINPQGTFVAYSGGASGPPRVWLTHIETRETHPLTPEGVFACHPVFSWDGKSIAFSADFDHAQPRITIDQIDVGGEPTTNYKLSIYACDSNGGNLQRITRGDWFDRRPTFSPDGETIAFVTNRDGKKYELWCVDSEGRNEPQKILQDDIGYRPWYSKDGTTLYFFSIVNDEHRLCRVPASGGRKVPLMSDGPGDNRGPFVDRSRNSLLMHSNRNGGWQIFELPLDGTPPKQITPPGIDQASHATKAKNSIMAFDVITAKPE